MIYIAVNQEYETEADNEYVILGNSAIMKCEIPSFVADLIQIISWKDSLGNIFTPSTVATGIFVETHVSPTAPQTVSVATLIKCFEKV